VTDGAQVKVIGAERLAATMRGAGRDIENMDAAGAKVQAQLTRDARGRAPKRTGRLARSVIGRNKGGDVEVGSSLVYAGVIHYGWPRHHIGAQPFLTDALAADAPRIVDIYRADVQRSLDQVKGA
jgi:phage gpG-like protein